MAPKENWGEKLKKNEIKEENQKSEKNEGARKSLFRRRESRWATVLKLIEKRKAETAKQNISQLERLGRNFSLEEVAESDEKSDVKVYPGFVFLKG